MNATRISEKEWVQWVQDFADIAKQENTDLKFRLEMLEKAARKRMAELQDEEYQQKDEVKVMDAMSEKITLEDWRL